MGSADFNRLFREARRYSTKSFMLLTAEAMQKKCGVAVSKKISGAVRRNRARRRCREILRLNQTYLPENKEIVLFVKPGVERLRHQDLTDEFMVLLQKAIQG